MPMPFTIIDKEKIIQLGYAEQVRDVENGICPHCKQKIDIDSFSTDFYREEYEICGYCESCTKEMMIGVEKSIKDGMCFRCRSAALDSDFESDFELRIYEKMGVCAKCQRQIAKLLFDE